MKVKNKRYLFSLIVILSTTSCRTYMPNVYIPNTLYVPDVQEKGGYEAGGSVGLSIPYIKINAYCAWRPADINLTPYASFDYSTGGRTSEYTVRSNANYVFNHSVSGEIGADYKTDNIKEPGIALAVDYGYSGTFGNEIQLDSVTGVSTEVAVNHWRISVMPHKILKINAAGNKKIIAGIKIGYAGMDKNFDSFLSAAPDYYVNHPAYSRIFIEPGLIIRKEKEKTSLLWRVGLAFTRPNDFGYDVSYSAMFSFVVLFKKPVKQGEMKKSDS